MDIHIRISRWVVWWIGIGVAVGAIALANVIGRDLTRRQDQIILLIGVVHWVLGGLVCWAFDGIEVKEPEKQRPTEAPRSEARTDSRTHSQFVMSGTRKSIMPPPY